MDSLFRNRQYLMKRRKLPARGNLLPLWPLLLNGGRPITTRKSRKGRSPPKPRKGIAFLPALIAGLGGLSLFSKLGNSLVNRNSGRKKRFNVRKKKFDIRKKRFNIRRGDLDANFLGEFGNIDDDVIVPSTQSKTRTLLNFFKKLTKNKAVKNATKNTAGALLQKIKSQVTKTPASNKTNKIIADMVVSNPDIIQPYTGRYSGRKRTKRVY